MELSLIKKWGCFKSTQKITWYKTWKYMKTCRGTCSLVITIITTVHLQEVKIEFTRKSSMLKIQLRTATETQARSCSIMQSFWSSAPAGVRDHTERGHEAQLLLGWETTQSIHIKESQSLNYMIKQKWTACSLYNISEHDDELTTSLHGTHDMNISIFLVTREYLVTNNSLIFFNK